MAISDNPLLLTDVYKISHMLQYIPDTSEVYSYLEARKPNEDVVFFGLQYLLQEYLSKPITHYHVDEFEMYHDAILGPTPQKIKDNLHALADLGYWPIKIKAVPEGTLLPTQNVLMTIKNTKPGFHWCVGFLESLLLKVWNPCTVATASMKYKKLVERYAELTCDNFDHIPFAVHDFGYRGVSSEETAAISGAGHLLNFLGSDTIPAVNLLVDYYMPSTHGPIGLSVPASEHSVMCSFGRENEIEAFRHMLRTYPTGIVSIVSDTYDLWNVLTNIAEELKDEILNRDGKVVFRPDSGDPVRIVCGDASDRYPFGAGQDVLPFEKGALELLWEKFGGMVNSKGYRVLNPKVGLIYGDGMYYERFEYMLETMKELGFASSNLVIGVGGLLLQNHSRDELGFAMKATRIIRQGSKVNIYKDPITDPGKRSKKGLMSLVKQDGKFMTIDEVSEEVEENNTYLVPIFEDGKILKRYSLEEVRRNLEESRR